MRKLIQVLTTKMKEMSAYIQANDWMLCSERPCTQENRKDKMTMTCVDRTYKKLIVLFKVFSILVNTR